MHFPYHSLEDFLVHNELTVDAQLDDRWGAKYAVKGREIEATVLFADITGFSKRTSELTPVESLMFANLFFTWVSAEGLQSSRGIVDKYIGDEMMVVFSKEFGSVDPFTDAVQTARRMCEHDLFNFLPHIGIASGQVVVGYVGTAKKYNCSVYGRPVVIAARCAQEKRPRERATGSMMFPSVDWCDRSFETVFSPPKRPLPNGVYELAQQNWEMQPARRIEPKNIPPLEIIEVINTLSYLSNFTAEQDTRDVLQQLREDNRYWPGNRR
jgi:Adenylate and Guanylate cyclase catalytic domain